VVTAMCDCRDFPSLRARQDLSAIDGLILQAVLQILFL
jgi:hypothetical protein